MAADTGNDGVTDSGEAGKSDRVRSHPPAKSCHLSQTASDESRRGIISQAQSVQHAGCYGYYVFIGPPDLHAYYVFIGIDPEISRAQDMLKPTGNLRIAAGDNRSARYFFGHFFSVIRAGK